MPSTTGDRNISTISHIAQDRSNYFKGNREDMRKFLPPDMRSVLDVGCAAGNFLGSLDIPGLHRVGIEPDQQAYEEARTKMEECFHSTFDEDIVRRIEARASNNRFDCIVFNDVLEHLVNPWGALELARRILSSEGVVVASIPNVLFYSNIANMIRNLDFKYENAGIMDITHLRFFTRKSMTRMFEETGYDVLEVEGISSAASLKFKLLNALFLNRFADLKYMQFAIVARSSTVGRSAAKSRAPAEYT